MQTITQTQISAYEKCRRFFFLKYIRRLAWPVGKADARNMKQGEIFHLLVRQLTLGFPEETLLIPDGDEKIRLWIDNFCREKPLAAFDHVLAEKEVSSFYSDVLWLGKFDALAVHDDRLSIFDWKTTAVRPDPEKYRYSPQTRLYRFLARICGPRLLGAGLHEIPAENIEMIYWFPEFPDLKISLPYSEEAYQEDLTYMRLKAHEMSSALEADYPECDKPRICSRCDYFAYCFPERAAAERMMPADPGSEEDGLMMDDIFQPELLIGFPPDGEDREEINY